MRLERLVIQGFKSFAEKTELVFSPGLSAVVGPNGSGKSNIADAVRWVLGEQSVRALRGQRMEDVIFAGSEGKRALGMAEVTVVFDNTDAFFPLDYSQVSVTRRLFRSGESEYLLNRAPCRLKDVADLFLDTGIGREGYALIGQGSIDAVLSSRPEDRRALFEAAAGIGRYKARKAEALRKLEHTEQNLIRVGDILSELDKQLGPLEEQAAKARRYRDLAREWEAWDLWVASLEEKENAAGLAALHADYQAVQSEHARLAAEQAAVDAELARINSALLEEENGAEKAHERMLLEAAAVERAQAKLDGISGLRQSLLERKAELEAERERVGEALELAEAGAREAASGRGEAEGRVKEEASALAAARTRLEEARGEGERATRAIDSLKGELLELLNRQAALEAEAGEGQAVHDGAGEDAAEEARLKTLIEEAVNGVAEVAERLAVLREDESRRVEAMAKLEKVRQALLASRNELLAELAVIRQQRGELSRRQAGAAARRQALLELEREGAGFGAGVREVLRLKAERGREFAGIIGVVADLVEVPAELEAAIGVALGAGAQNVVVADEATARAAVLHLKKSGAGRVTFLPLDILKPRTFSVAERRQLEGDGILGGAADLVRATPELGPALDYLLGRTVVAEKLALATDLARRTGAGFRTVTLDGELVSVGGAITGGVLRGDGRAYGRDGRDGRAPGSDLVKGVLSRQRDLRELQELLESLLREDEAAAAKAQAAEARLAELGRELEKAEAAVVEARREAAAEAEAIRAAEKDGVHLAKRLDELRESQAQLVRRRQRLAERRGKAKEQLGFLEKERARLDSQLNLAEQARDRARLLENETSEEVTMRRVAMAKTEEAARNATDGLKRLQGEAEARRVEWERRGTEFDALVGRLLGLDAEEDSYRLELTRAREVQGASASEWEERKQARQGLLAQVEERSRRAREVAARAAQAGSRLSTLEVEKTRIEAALERLAERLSADHGIALTDLAARAALAAESGLVAPHSSAREARSRAELLRRRLRELGPVSLESIDEYEAQSQRYRFLKEQYEDLVAARASLVQTIERIDRTTGQLFRESFNEVNRCFGEVFRRLFGGGQAGLSLTDPDNIEQTGVEITVQPPGKKLSALSLLSGGERSMTAIALLMAFMRVRPAPFCVLDEIDAALDDANVRRFAALLLDFAQRTQFIIITHRRGTMEIANSLYGVTMDETGISKLVSVKLEEAG